MWKALPMDCLQNSDLAWHKHRHVFISVFRHIHILHNASSYIADLLGLGSFSFFFSSLSSGFLWLGAALLPLLITTHLLSSPGLHHLWSTAASIHCPILSSWGLCVFAFWFLDHGLCTDVSSDLPFCLFRVPRLSRFNQPVTPSLLPQSLSSSHFHHPSAVDILCCTNKHYFLWKVTPDILYNDLDSLKVCSLNTINVPIIEIGTI